MLWRVRDGVSDCTMFMYVRKTGSPAGGHAACCLFPLATHHISHSGGVLGLLRGNAGGLGGAAFSKTVSLTAPSRVAATSSVRL
eukprot:COSAG03_NODE_3988_length_1728_cov_5.914672_1_plen_83_part_10